jgi:hypothetical protein
MSVLATALALLSNFYSLEELAEIFSIFIVEGIVSISIVFSLIRIVHFYRQLYRSSKQKEKDAIESRNGGG